MLNTKSQCHQPSGSGEKYFKGFFTIYECGGHLGHVTTTIYIIFGLPIISSLHVKFEFNWPLRFLENDVLVYRCDSNMSDLG